MPFSVKIPPETLTEPILSPRQTVSRKSESQQLESGSPWSDPRAQPLPEGSDAEHDSLGSVAALSLPKTSERCRMSEEGVKGRTVEMKEK